MQVEQTGLAEMLQMLVKDRRWRDEELAEERRRRSDELAEERMRHDEEVRLLRQMVEETLGRRVQPSVVPGGDGNSRVKLTKLGTMDDIEAYLTTFERMMVAYEVPKKRWAFMLVPQLMGKAQQAYAAMDMALSADYDEVKAAVIRRYGINEEAYRQRFRSAERKEDETHRELAIRLGDFGCGASGRNSATRNSGLGAGAQTADRGGSWPTGGRLLRGAIGFQASRCTACCAGNGCTAQWLCGCQEISKFGGGER